MVEIKSRVIETIKGREDPFTNKISVIREKIEPKKELRKEIIQQKKSFKPKRKKVKTLRKPKVKLPSYSPTKFVADLAQSQGSLVHEIQNRYADPPQDNRSQFFRENYTYEKKKAFGGFL